MGRNPSSSREIGLGGRPRDTFLWGQLVKSKDGKVEIIDGKVECLYCKKKFAAAAQRIRVHLSGEGIGISYCPSVPGEIREEAKKKKLDNMTEVGEDRNVALAFDRKKKSVQGGGVETEDAYLKFLLCTDHRTISLCPLEYLKNPSFMKLMETGGGNPVDPSQLSMAALKIKQEVETHMLTVKTQFWNTTGRTLMLINLPSRLSYRPVIVVVIYCPKGIFFVKPTKSDLNSEDPYYEETLQLHSPELCADEGVQWLSHCANVETDTACGCEPYSTDSWKNYPPSGEIFNCLREEIRLSCEKICSESEWAKNLFDIAEKIHWSVYHSKDDWCYYSANKKATRLEMLMSIIPYEEDHVECLDDSHVLILDASDRNEIDIYRHIDQIIKGTKFWNEGENLEMIILYVMGMGYMMDTIVPTAGYLGIALDRVGEKIEGYMQHQADKEDALEFWRMVKSELEGRIKGSRLAACYLNPVYFLQQLKKDPLLPINELKAALADFAIKQEVNLEEINKEVDSFADEFKVVNQDLDLYLEDYHPVTLWEKYGSRLPNLQKCAVMLLNRPLCCMSKQMKKHLYNLNPHGAPDYITTLNLRMMLHLERLGDDIYKPLDLSELDAMCEYVSLNLKASFGYEK